MSLNVQFRDMSVWRWFWETDFCTPPVLGGVALFDNSAPVVYKNPVPKDPEFYTPLALNCQEGQHLPALEVYKNQSPRFEPCFKNIWAVIPLIFVTNGKSTQRKSA